MNNKDKEENKKDEVKANKFEIMKKEITVKYTEKELNITSKINMHNLLIAMKHKMSKRK